VQRAVERFGAGDAGVGDLDWRDFAFLDELRGLGQRQVDQVRFGYDSTSSRGDSNVRRELLLLLGLGNG
jgi:hypothetical protein